MNRMETVSARSFLCDKCPVGSSARAARPAIVQLGHDGNWRLIADDCTVVHLVALFRDPGIVDSRVVERVLDLRVRPDGGLSAGKKGCWVRQFLKALSGIPVGLTVALDNGVRCPCRTDEGYHGYKKRAEYCHLRTAEWFGSLRHPDGGIPGIVICNKDLTCALAELGFLTKRNGENWRMPRRFVDALGTEITYLQADGIICGHPSNFLRRHNKAYVNAVARRHLVKKLIQLSRFDA